MLELLLWATLGAAFLAEGSEPSSGYSSEDLEQAWSLFWTKFMLRGGSVSELPEEVQVAMDQRMMKSELPPGWIYASAREDEPRRLLEVVPEEYRQASWNEGTKKLLLGAEQDLPPSQRKRILAQRVGRHGEANIEGLKDARGVWRRLVEDTVSVYIVLFEPNREAADRVILLRRDYSEIGVVSSEAAEELISKAYVLREWDGWTGHDGGPYDAVWIRAEGAV